MILRCFDHFVLYSPIITTAFTQTNIDNFIEHQRGFPLSLEPSDITAGNRDISHGKYLRSALADLGIHVGTLSLYIRLRSKGNLSTQYF